MIKENADMLEGNDKFEGYCIDLIHELSAILGFKYSIQLVKDKAHGSKNERGEWNGMIRELIDRDADMAIADLTMTYEREESVDFTMPFMNLGISILFKKPTVKVPKLFQFLAPLSLDVWIYMATSYLGISLMLFILARLSPYEWDNPHPCDPDNDVLENQFNLNNSFWFIIGSLMQQGSDIAPKAMSTRLLAGIWWFFTLIMISSYTANLAAFLTAERMTAPIGSAEDLAKQTKIQYGCLKSGSTKSFFQSSNIPTYKRMWAAMESSRPTVFAESNAKGVERVLKGNYAYLMESTSIEYRTERNCDLMQIGGLLDQKGYGIATPPGSPFTNALSSAILNLQEEGKLHVLKSKWWKKKGGDKCTEEGGKASGSESEMGLANVGGVFVVLLMGLSVACVIAVMEFVWKTQKVAREERESMCTELIQEIKQILHCRGSTRPAPKTPEEGSQADIITIASLRTVNTVTTRP
ncbi:glutamate receptor ionotropic, kainate 2-like [Limulus polyphemus]|uniref:Glutamate receptor ionotropic, kainate 2-like n=1 Tax=Limulus polyphemus TaxID=6850 RepID=A0ABM1BSN0_LIMPO|nr:glutamate receptor ionotropic, kainate 2-like [Limulus polyphemus]